MQCGKYRLPAAQTQQAAAEEIHYWQYRPVFRVPEAQVTSERKTVRQNSFRDDCHADPAGQAADQQAVQVRHNREDGGVQFQRNLQYAVLQQNETKKQPDSAHNRR